MFAGLRVTAPLGLRWGDLDFHAVAVHVTAQLGADGASSPALGLCRRARVRRARAVGRRRR
jgi:hypothetical protein